MIYIHTITLRKCTYCITWKLTADLVKYTDQIFYSGQCMILNTVIKKDRDIQHDTGSIKQNFIVKLSV